MRFAYVFVAAGLVVAAFTPGATGAPASTAVVVNSNDAGAGSFRAAVASANASVSIDRILFRTGLAPIALKAASGPVVYTGKQGLEIFGSGAIVDGGGLGANDDAFMANGGGNLSVSLLTIRRAPQQGLTYQVPVGATGLKKVSLAGVTIRDNEGHGVLVNDQDFPEEAGDPDAEPDPIPPTADGSEAGLEVRVVGSRLIGNGFSTGDRDGLRVNEGDGGSLTFVAALTQVEANGGDGIELDERGAGDVVFDLTGVELVRNGEKDPADLDDGMDIDESFDGSVRGKVVASVANDNFEEGWDFNENDAGDFLVDMTLVDASRNNEEGVDFEEDDDFAGGGNLRTVLTGVKADGNQGGDGGIKIREKSTGDLDAILRATQANGNLADGISIREDAAGNLTAAVERSTANANGDPDADPEDNVGDGIHFDERSSGTLTAVASRGNANGNLFVGVRADQGTGTLGLQFHVARR